MPAAWLLSSQKLKNTLADCHKKTAPRNGDDNNASNPGRSWLPICRERISIIASKSSPWPIKDGEEKYRNLSPNLLLLFVYLLLLFIILYLANEEILRENLLKNYIKRKKNESRLIKENISIKHSTLEMWQYKYCIDFLFLIVYIFYVLFLSLFYFIFIFYICHKKTAKLRNYGVDRSEWIIV